MSFVKFGRNIGEFVSRYRVSMDMTQEDLGKLLGISRDYVARVENNLAANPVSFCRRLRPHLEKDRVRYFDDLLQQIALDKLEMGLEEK